MTARDIIQRSVALVGFMASGKSTIGRELSLHLAMPFVDTDSEIEAAFGLTVSEIFARYGEERFRTAERETISRLLGRPPQILSLGGGAYLDPPTRALLNEQATTVWLDPPFELILERVRKSSGRPLASQMSEDALRHLWNERSATYARAHLRVTNSDPDPAIAVAMIVDLLHAA